MKTKPTTKAVTRKLERVEAFYLLTQANDVISGLKADLKDKKKETKRLTTGNKVLEGKVNAMNTRAKRQKELDQQKQENLGICLNMIRELKKDLENFRQRIELS